MLHPPDGTNVPQAPTPDTSARLEAAQLLLLQLHARGYAAEQLAMLLRRELEEVSALLANAADTLRVPDLRGAVREAKRRGLID